MKLVQSLLVAAVLLIATTATPASAQSHRLSGRSIGAKQTPSCVFRYREGSAHFSKNEVRSTIRCAVKRWAVPGGLNTALYIARRESGFNWFAANPTSSASGVYQFVDGTWASQIAARSDFVRTQHLSRSVFNARSSVLIAVKLAHGCWCWTPWTTAP